MAYYITEPLGGSDDVVVSVYKNTGEYVGNIIVDRYKWRMSSDEETRYSIGQFKAENAESRNPSYDCGENVELFKALAAMNDENDREQWFIAEEAKAWVNQGLYAPIGSFENACWSIGSVSPPVRPRLRRLSNISKRGRNDTSKILYQIQRLR